jgi:hypothetical protein
VAVDEDLRRRPSSMVRSARSRSASPSMPDLPQSGG